MPGTDKRLQKVLDLVARLQEDNEEREQLMPVWNARVAKLEKDGVDLANEIVRMVQTGSAKNAEDLLKKLKNYPDLKRDYDGLVKTWIVPTASSGASQSKSTNSGRRRLRLTRNRKSRTRRRFPNHAIRLP